MSLSSVSDPLSILVSLPSKSVAALFPSAAATRPNGPDKPPTAENSMAGCGVMQLAHIPGIPAFFIHNGAPQALVGCLARLTI
jgi:hypothetical protein